MTISHSDPPYRIGIPLGTRLIGLTRQNNAWQVWTAIRNRQDNPSEWEGTYLKLYDNGRVTRVQNDVNPPDVMEIKDADDQTK